MKTLFSKGMFLLLFIPAIGCNDSTKNGSSQTYPKGNETSLLRVDTADNFRSIVNSINAYVNTHKRLPQHTYYDEKTGKPLYSWRYRIIPYVGSYGRKVFYELPWDHSKNSIWLQIPQPYAYSGFKEGVWQSASESIPNKTNVFAITGPDTGFGDEPVEFAKLPKDLILIMEIADSGKHWMEPGDFDIRTLTAEINSTKLR